MLHYLDDLDSKMESMRAHFEREAESDSSWTSYNASLGRTLLNTAKFLNPEEKSPVDASVPGRNGSKAAGVDEPVDATISLAEEKL